MKIKVIFLLAVILISSSPVFAQKKEKKKRKKETIQQVDSIPEQLFQEPEVPEWVPKKGRYNASNPKLFDLLHTKLEASFDWQKQRLNGVATLRLKPHFYPKSLLELDAIGFLIHDITINNQKLNFDYDSAKITIELPKMYARSDSFEVKIAYTARPNEISSKGSKAIGDDKGLYFINPTGKNPFKPRQIWTQGETQANSCWLPTIDAPNTKSKQEMLLTVEKNFKTLSNGRLLSSKENPDGTRTDHWLMDKPHAVYLFMMAIGEYEIVTDSWRGKEVSYWVEPEFKTFAKAIFGRTPQMLEYFSNLLDYPYPWDKYSQVVVRDFVSGAMENTSASIFMEDLNVDNNFLLDENWDKIIAHELFHHWFGDLVTCESWANLPLNESFANYSESLWLEHYYGEEQAENARMEEQANYLFESKSKREPLIRYFHTDREDMFDSHSYAKGGLILHLLRSYVGDEAFFASLSLYLKKNQYKTAEIHDLRMAFEEVTGNDMNWFFDQFFLKPGHPELKISDSYQNGQLQVIIEQKQNLTYLPLYRIPVKLTLFLGKDYKTFDFSIGSLADTFKISDVPKAPDLVVFNSDYSLFGEFEHKKSTENLIFQYQNALSYRMAHEALESLSPLVADPKVLAVVMQALDSKYKTFRQMAAYALIKMPPNLRSKEIKTILRAKFESDPEGIVRAACLRTLNKWGEIGEPELQAALSDSSYKVLSEAIEIYATAGANPDEVIPKFENSRNNEVLMNVAGHYIEKKSKDKNDWFETSIQKLGGYKSAGLMQYYGYYNYIVDESDHKRAVDFFIDNARNQSNSHIKVAAWFSLVVYADKTADQKLVEIAKSILENEKSEKTQRDMIQSLQR
jgi:aminopeptidase N